ncbi:hypothetical protein DFH09DRAFT_1315336 [Mycena vulgaris]|nr:hypothetical protein DFH09DRAFT_1315336 [Mycena vulgaris]
MSGSGATYYNEELKELLRLLNHFMAAPEKISANAPGPSNVSDQPPVAQVSDDCEAGLAAVNEIDDSSESGSPLGSLAFDIERDGVNITIPFFRDCLSDEPVPGADEIRSSSLISRIGRRAVEIRQPHGSRDSWAYRFRHPCGLVGTVHGNGG